MSDPTKSLPEVPSKREPSAIADILRGCTGQGRINRVEPALQALYEAVAVSLPKKATGGNDDVARGYNLALKHTEEVLAVLFGISKEGEKL